MTTVNTYNVYNDKLETMSISAQRWTNGNYQTIRWYDYSYDRLNRLRSVTYSELDDHSLTSRRYDEEALKYDGNGNIERLQRCGGDNVAHYEYYDMGSLIEDTDRGIAMIEYDDFNNPRRIQFTNGNVTKYVYTATGEKLRTIHYTAAPDITVPYGQTHALVAGEILYADSTDYVGNLILSNFHFFNYDHLGNVCEVVGDDGALEQVNNYYPFGTPFTDNTTSAKNPDLQPYKYTDKELDLTHGLKTYDHGARQNYSILGVWDRVDPMAEKYYNLSPYVFCGNNPIIKYDPNGEIVIACDYYARRNIINTLNEDERKYIQFDKYGRLDNFLLNKYEGTSENYNALKTLSGSETVYSFIVSVEQQTVENYDKNH